MSGVCISDDQDFESAAMMKIPATKRLPKGGSSTLTTMAKECADKFATYLVGFASPGFHEIDTIVICVETPRVGRYTQKAARGADPQDVANLAMAGGIMAGSLTGALHQCFEEFDCKVPNIKFVFPYPQEWKGSVPKDVHQNNTAKRLGLICQKDKKGFPVPQKRWWDRVHVFGRTPAGKQPKLAAGDWKDLLDSWGLALWARSRHKFLET
jgi:hypothetical protein